MGLGFAFELEKNNSTNIENRYFVKSISIKFEAFFTGFKQNYCKTLNFPIQLRWLVLRKKIRQRWFLGSHYETNFVVGEHPLLHRIFIYLSDSSFRGLNNSRFSTITFLPVTNDIHIQKFTLVTNKSTPPPPPPM